MLFRDLVSPQPVPDVIKQHEIHKALEFSWRYLAARCSLETHFQFTVQAQGPNAWTGLPFQEGGNTLHEGCGGQ